VRSWALAVPAVILVALGCSSPAPREDTALLARLAAIEGRLGQLERRGEPGLEKRGAPLVREEGTAQLAAIGALSSRIVALEERIALLEAAMASPSRAPAAQASEDNGATVIDRRKSRARPPSPGEVVRPLAAIDGETFSFVVQGELDLARLVGIEVPLKGMDEARRARALGAWPGLDLDAAAAKVRSRLEDLLASGELSFTYPEAPAVEKRGLLVYARLKAKDGELVLNEVLLREGLALARGEHAERARYEKLEAEAREQKRGFFAR
jgi:endonuclease YncB( thermonuclease family)